MQTTSWSVQPFLHRWPQSVPIVYNGTPFPLPWWDLDPHLIHDSLGPPKSSTHTTSWAVQLFLKGSLVWHTDRQTDRQTTLLGLVTVGRNYVRSTVMLPKKWSWNAPILCISLWASCCTTKYTELVHFMLQWIHCDLDPQRFAERMPSCKEWLVCFFVDMMLFTNENNFTKTFNARQMLQCKTVIKGDVS